MTLNLDARQRAMLQEMGYTSWWPQPAAPAPEAPTAPAARAAVAPPQALAPAVAPADPAPAPVIAAPAAIDPPPARPAPAPAARPAAAPEAAPATTALPSNLAPPAFALGAPVPLFDTAKADGDASAGPAWLVVAELPAAASPAATLASPRGELLRNLLRAMRLQGHPRLWWVPLLRAHGDAAPEGAATMAALARELQPGMVLLMGLPAARHLLESSEPLGQLRGQVHQLPHAGAPAVVSHDPAYLLRTPRAKADAWADACLALAAVRNQK